ncbi:hypothetical protein [Vibrio mimicus]|uniref:hypothetical protein n=1 Tax=Vibrio mimicus TaxID=674 RepID=UPI002FF23132
MTKKKLNNKPSLSLEVVAAITMGILALGCFAIQAKNVSSSTTNTETALFNTLQFLLTVAFSWFSTRAISRKEFEESLKKHAVSAYRRISDIDSMLLVLKSEIKSSLENNPNSDSGDLRVLEALVISTSQVVYSSSDDWADIIGEEILAIERLKRLERDKEDERQNLELTGYENSESNKLEELERSISELRASLPASLSKEVIARKKQKASISIPKAASWLAQKHHFEGGLILKFISGEGYSDESDTAKIKYSDIRTMIREEGTRGINLIDAEGNILGRILNPVSDLGGVYDHGARALRECYGGFPIEVEYLGKDNSHVPSKGDFPHHYVKVKDNPQIDAKLDFTPGIEAA